MTIEVNLRMNCPYTNDLIRNVLNDEQGQFKIVTTGHSMSSNCLHWLEYEDLDFDLLYRLNRNEREKETILANAFCIRKGLIRKANFASFMQKYVSKVNLSLSTGNSQMYLRMFFFFSLTRGPIRFFVSIIPKRIYSI
jgi:hypothetical protein